MITLLSTGTELQKPEAIDAIGYICFYEHCEEYLYALIDCYQTSQNNLIQWKIIRAMSGFPGSIYFLEEEINKTANQDLRKEMERVMIIITKRAANN